MSQPKVTTVKLTCYVPERVRRALNISSALSGRPVGDILSDLVLSGLGKAVRLADESIEEGSPPPKGKPGPKPGTKRRT